MSFDTYNNPILQYLIDQKYINILPIYMKLQICVDAIEPCAILATGKENIIDLHKINVYNKRDLYKVEELIEDPYQSNDIYSCTWLHAEITFLNQTIIDIIKDIEYPILTNINILDKLGQPPLINENTSIKYIQNMIYALFVYSFFIEDSDQKQIHTLVDKYLSGDEKKELLNTLLTTNKIIELNINDITLPTNKEFVEKIQKYIIEHERDSSSFFTSNE
jgi:hypothetical protein